MNIHGLSDAYYENNNGKTPYNVRESESTARVIWSRYRDLIEKKFPNFCGLEMNYFVSRETSQAFMSVNAMAAIDICQIYHVYDYETIISFGIAHLYLDHFTQVLDDATDQIDSPKELLHLSHLLLMEGIKVYESFAGDNSGLKSALHAQISDVMYAERALWKYKNPKAGILFDENDIALIARRGGMIQCMSILLSGITKNTSINTVIKEALDEAVTGIQLMDDIIDWESDLREGTLTWLLSLASSACSGFGENKNPSSNFRNIIESNAIKTVSEKAALAFESAEKKFRLLGAENFAIAMFGMRASVLDIIKQVSIMRFGSNEQNFLMYENFNRMIASCDARLEH